MAAVDDFLRSTLPALEAADAAFHDGDPGGRSRTWSHSDPVTLFGAVFTASGWAELEDVFSRLASQFSACESFRYEVIAAGVSGDLAYIAGVEHTVVSVGGADPEPYELRVTQVFRREDGDWKVVHRHADPVPGRAAADRQVERLAKGTPPGVDPHQPG